MKDRSSELQNDDSEILLLDLRLRYYGYAVNHATMRCALHIWGRWKYGRREHI